MPIYMVILSLVCTIAVDVLSFPFAQPTYNNITFILRSKW